MPRASSSPEGSAATPDDRVEAAREGMSALVSLLDEQLDKLEKQYEEVECRDRRRAC